jgi:hypothetical protein
MKAFIALLIVGAIVALIAAGRTSAKRQTATGGPRESVGFAVTELSSDSAGRRRFLITFAASDEATPVSFEFEYASKPVPEGQIASVVKGSLERLSDTDPREFVSAVAEVHGIAVPTGDVTAAKRMLIELAVFGEALHLGRGKQQVAGLFTTDSVGPWIATKLFLPVASRSTKEAEEEGHSEVFLALNPKEGFGVLYPKDNDYADGVVRGFAALLKP